MGPMRFPTAIQAVVTVSRSKGYIVEGDFRNHVEVRHLLKAHGFKWSRKFNLWYVPNTRQKDDVEMYLIFNRAIALVGLLQRDFGLDAIMRYGIGDKPQPESVSEGSAPECARGPVVDPEPRLVDADRGGWIGSRYESTRHLTPKEIAALVRSDIAAAKQEGVLAPNVNVSVRLHRYSGGWSLNVRVKHWSSPWRFTDGEVIKVAPNVTKILETLRSIMDQYNFDHSDSMTDYFSVRFYGFPEMDWETCDMTLHQVSHDHPVFVAM